MIEVRPCEPDEVVRAIAPIWHYFGRTPTEESAERATAFIEPGRMHGAWADGALVGGTGVFPFELTVPGAQLPAAGIIAVGVLPTHRRRGILTSLMRAQLDDVYARGEPLAILWASDERIYVRFGYGLATLTGEIDLLRDHAAFHQPLTPIGQGRLVSAAEALEILPPVYERIAADLPGMYSRSRRWWELRTLDDRPERRSGGGELAVLLLEVDGSVEGYATYRLHLQFEAGQSKSFVHVIEALGATPEVTRDLWRTLLDIDWMERIRATLLPVDHPLFLLLAEPRRMRFRVGDGLFLRLVDVGAALSGRSYAGEGPVVLEVTDDFCPWNAGRWRLDGGEAKRTDRESDLRCDVTALGSVYLGGFTFERLARAGRIEEVRVGGVARADTLFRSDRAPWCPEIF
jgi:predicted acetyltransferase